MQAFLTLFVLFIQLLYTRSASQCILRTNYSSKVAYTITVSQSGDGNFSKVQDAIDSIPSGNNQWIRIYVNPGTYREQVKIPYDKQFIVLEGHSRTDTTIEYDGHDATDTSSTFTSSADNFVAKNICFTNTYNFHGEGPIPRGEVKQAVAASIYGDKSAFYNCGFIGYQDTLWDVSRRHYFKSCYIEGAIDFIWGDGQSFYEDCDIYVCGDGYVTAQGRNSLVDPSGFVFERGSIYGSGHVYLGRAYGAYSRVIFQHTLFTNVVNPLGWDAWGFVGHENKLTYCEIGCNGDGANTSQRVGWWKSTQKLELPKYTRDSFINQDGWINRQP